MPNIIVAVVILVIAAVLAGVLTEVLSPLLGTVRGGTIIAKGAGLAVLVVGVFAALDQLQVAPAIVRALLRPVVMIVGSAVVAFGVGGIPIARRWLERWSGGVERTARDVKGEVQSQTERSPDTSPMPEAPPERLGR